MVEDWDTAYKEKGILQKPILDIMKEVVDLFKERNVKRVLDNGFGSGRHTVLLAKHGFDVHGIDISKEGKKITERLLKEKGLKAKLKIANVVSLPYKNEFFDAIICTYVLGHGMKKDIIKAFDEMKRVLKKSGILVLVVLSTKDDLYGKGEEIEPNTFLGVPDIDRDVPHHFYTKEELKDLLPNFKFIKFEEKVGFTERRKCQFGAFDIIAEKL